MLLNLSVGQRVKFSSGHEHSLGPGFQPVGTLTQEEKMRLRGPGPKVGTVVRMLADKCSLEVGKLVQSCKNTDLFR